jgi:hypothetical protein
MPIDAVHYMDPITFWVLSKVGARRARLIADPVEPLSIIIRKALEPVKMGEIDGR